MPILLGQVAVIVLMLAIGNVTYRLETIRENRPEFESPGIYHRRRDSLGTKRQALKRLGERWFLASADIPRMTWGPKIISCERTKSYASA